MLLTAIAPMTAEAADEPFDDEAFLFEPKWDGGRLLLHKQGERCEIYTRSGRIVTEKLPELREALADLPVRSVLLDGEGIVLRSGRPVFDDWAYRLRISQAAKIRTARQTHPVVFAAFDVLCTDRPHLEEPLTQRKARLGELLQRGGGILTPTVSVEAQGRRLYELTAAQELEGIVAKRKTSLYIPGRRSSDWIKIKHPRLIDTVILGCRSEPFELVVGLQFRTVKNKPVGLVSKGLTVEDRDRFLQAARELRVRQEGGVQWIEPRLCCRISYRDRSEMHQLEDTEFLAFLWDKQPEECVWPYT
ncbi:ATP-dependent DNA ligase [Paenibacillus caseinilyticus]|uniref:DNA ligase n=1 Tax=Paenibacillus mucilaginosus K02 TaxID=997761 RepID=I0BPX8_9BACL|nr:DNA ligase [Paenibacillus mucilaginosus]AFH64425.1 DNA ligase [Paenibacillus mucilaginosus K02]